MSPPIYIKRLNFDSPYCNRIEIIGFLGFLKFHKIKIHLSNGKNDKGPYTKQRRQAWGKEGGLPNVYATT